MLTKENIASGLIQSMGPGQQPQGCVTRRSFSSQLQTRVLTVQVQGCGRCFLSPLVQEPLRKVGGGESTLYCEGKGGGGVSGRGGRKSEGALKSKKGGGEAEG